MVTSSDPGVDGYFLSMIICEKLVAGLAISSVHLDFFLSSSSCLFVVVVVVVVVFFLGGGEGGVGWGGGFVYNSKVLEILGIGERSL